MATQKKKVLKIVKKPKTVKAESKERTVRKKKAVPVMPKRSQMVEDNWGRSTRAALTIDRGGGKKTTVDGKKPRRTKALIAMEAADRDMVRHLTQLVKRELEGKPLRRRKKYVSQTSTTIRVPLPILKDVQKMVADWKKKNGYTPPVGRPRVNPREDDDGGDFEDEDRY